MAEFKIDPDYKEVAERLRDLFAKFPDASMRGTYEFVEGHVIYRAECYRTPDDQAPGVGTAWEPVPGTTPYTRGSEMQNAETSAWGRAIVAVGASESKRIASADDIRLANDRRSAPSEPVHVPASEERVERCKQLVLANDLAEWVKQQDYRWPWDDVACAAIEAYAAKVVPTDYSMLAGKPEADSEPVMTRTDSKARESKIDPTNCPECGCGPLDAHLPDCSLQPF